MKWHFIRALFLAPLSAAAFGFQVQEVTGDIFGDVVVREKIAAPDFKLSAEGRSYSEAWRTINEVLRSDLQNSGYFETLSQDRVRLIRSPHDGPIDFEEWGSIEAQHLIVGEVKDQDGAMRLEVRLYEIASRQAIIAKAYRGKTSLARKMAHTIADDILIHLRNSRFALSKILFTRETPSATDSTRTLKELYIMDYDGYNPLPITKGGIALSPSAARIGRETFIAYAVYENAYTFNATYGIYLKPTLLSRPRPLFTDRNKRAASPAISPDGKKLAFSIAQDGNVDIYVMGIDGSDLLRLTRHPGVDTNPSWAPGGRALLFTSDRTGAPQIYRMDADGLNLVRLTNENPYNDSATWNPRFDYMAYVSRFDNDFDIFIMDLKTRRSYRVTNRQGSNEEPCWSPDGEQLCFASNRSGVWQVYAVNKNGSNLRQITNSGSNRDPVWIP